MIGAVKAGFVGLAVVGAAHADVGREQMLDEAVRLVAAKLEAEWQQCLSKPETKTTNDSGLCAYAMLQAAQVQVKEKYQKVLVRTQEYAGKGWLPKHIPAMLPLAQTDWERYVSADCSVVGAMNTGSGSSTDQTLCEYKHQIQRLHALDEW